MSRYFILTSLRKYNIAGEKIDANEKEAVGPALQE
jgi:hypothetical protein